MTSLIDFPIEFIHFTNLQWEKIKQKEKKYKNSSLEYIFLKEHFVDEILECFHLQGTQALVVRNILMSHCIKQDELVDVANMAFAITIAIDSDECKHCVGCNGK